MILTLVEVLKIMDSILACLYLVIHLSLDEFRCTINLSPSYSSRQESLSVPLMTRSTVVSRIRDLKNGGQGCDILVYILCILIIAMKCVNHVELRVPLLAPIFLLGSVISGG